MAKKTLTVSGKQAVQAQIKYEVNAKVKSRTYYAEGDVGTYVNDVLKIEQVGNNVLIRLKDCDTQIQTTLPTIKAIVNELDKKVEIN